MRRLLIAAVVLAAPGWAGTAGAQAWPRAAGEYFAIVRGGHSETRSELNYQGTKQPIYAEDPARSNARYREITADGYLEYGLSRRFTLVSSLAFKNVRTWEDIRLIAALEPQEAIRTNYGFSDLWLMLRTPLHQGRLTASLQYGVKIPLGYDATPENQGPPLGTGEADGDFGIYAGAPFLSSAYVSGGGSYRVRGGEFNDEWWFNAEIGGTWRRVFAKGRLEVVRNVEDPVDLAGQTVVTPFPAGTLNQVIVGNQDITKLVASAAVGLTRRVSVLGEVYHVLSGKNALDGTTFIIGVLHRSP